MVAGGLEALDWLDGIQTGAEGRFRPVGTESFGRGYALPQGFGQQPLEAWVMIDACAAALEAGGRPRWRAWAEAAHDWYLGRNDLGLRLVAPEGGCFDGLEVDRANLNRGAESTLALQFAILGFRRLRAAAAELVSHAAPGSRV